MPAPRPRTARNTVVIVSNGESTKYKPGDLLPPLVDLEDVPTDGPTIGGTDVPVQYLYEYMENANNLYAFLDDFPQVNRKQALAALRKRVDSNDVIFSDRNYVSGTPIFKGTRVPIDILFEFLAAGENIDEFVDCFPSVSREQAIEALLLAQHALESVAYESYSG